MFSEKLKIFRSFSLGFFAMEQNMKSLTFFKQNLQEKNIL